MKVNTSWSERDKLDKEKVCVRDILKNKQKKTIKKTDTRMKGETDRYERLQVDELTRQVCDYSWTGKQGREKRQVYIKKKSRIRKKNKTREHKKTNRYTKKTE